MASAARSNHFDVIVVGAGSAGAALAVRLTEDANRKVLLVEAGHDYSNIDELPDEIRQGHATGTMAVAAPPRSARLFTHEVASTG